MKIADHIRVHRRLAGVPSYFHHGIFVGRGRVIHYSGDAKNKQDASIRRGSIAEFASGADVHVVNYKDALTKTEVIFRAESCLGERDYDLAANNCEHFAVWCKTGRFRSGQVETVRQLPILDILGGLWLDIEAIAIIAARHRTLNRALKMKEREAKQREDQQTRDLKFEVRRQVHLVRAALDGERQLAFEARSRLRTMHDDAIASVRHLNPEDQEALFVLRQANALLALAHGGAR